MEVLFPSGVLILSCFLGAVFFKQCLTERKIYIAKLIYALTFVAIYVLIVFVFAKDFSQDEKLNKYANYFYFASYLILGLTFAINTKNSISKKFLNDEYYKCIEEEKLFVLIDKNGKIKSASKLFLENTDVEQKIIGEKFINIFNDNFSLVAINEQPYKNEDLARIFDELKKETQNLVLTRELKVYKKSDNKPYVLRFKDHILIENGKYKGHILMGDERTGEEMFNVEAKLESSESSLDNIRLRFTTNLEQTKEAIFFYNLDDNTMWGNDTFKTKLGFNQNSIVHDDFIKYIHHEDISYYQETINNLTIDNADYEITYRFKTGANYNYVKEIGRRLFGNTNEIMGHIELLNANHFENSGKNELDNILDEDSLNAHLRTLLDKNVNFELVLFKFASIEAINESYGRKMGNLVMANYIKALSQNFVENNAMYRLTGLEFAMIITDYRKMSLLEQHLKKGTILTVSMRFGSISITSKTSMGLVMSTDLRAKSDLILAARQALKLAQSEQVSTNYFFYKDI